MTKRILVMGLPGSGKTTFSQELVKKLMLTHTVAWYNADEVRRQYNDWDFSAEGRLRQVNRMRDLANASEADIVICDFVCPTQDYRAIFNPDHLIWMDTITEGRFADTNKVFEEPLWFTYRVSDWNQTDGIINTLVAKLNFNDGDSHKRSLFKAISWRTLGTVDTFILSWIIIGRVDLAAAIGGVELITKTALYYLHERAWTKIKVR